MTNICIWGDSVLKGVVFDEELNKYVFLENTCIDKTAAAFNINYLNNSRFGMTTPKAYRLMKKALEDMDFKADFALIELGGNDSDFNWKEVAKDPKKNHLPKTPIALYEENINGMIEMLREKNIEPVLTNLHPIDPVRYFNWITKDNLSKDSILEWLKDVFMIYRFQEMYSLTVTKISRQKDVRLIDIRKAFLKAGNLRDFLCEDGIHPNEKGHELMTQCMIEYIEDYRNMTLAK